MDTRRSWRSTLNMQTEAQIYQVVPSRVDCGCARRLEPCYVRMVVVCDRPADGMTKLADPTCTIPARGGKFVCAAECSKFVSLVGSPASHGCINASFQSGLHTRACMLAMAKNTNKTRCCWLGGGLRDDGAHTMLADAIPTGRVALPVREAKMSSDDVPGADEVLDPCLASRSLDVREVGGE